MSNRPSHVVRPNFQTKELEGVCFRIERLTGKDILLYLVPFGLRIRIIAKRLLKAGWSEFDLDQVKAVIDIPGRGHFRVISQQGHVIGIPLDEAFVRAAKG